MNAVLLTLILNLPSMICASGAIYLLAKKGGKSEGWGWLIFAAILLAHG
jgi:hypothetical protein